MADLRLGLKLTADAEGLVAEVKRSQSEVSKLSKAAGDTSSSLNAVASSSTATARAAGQLNDTASEVHASLAGATGVSIEMAGAVANLATNTRLTNQQLQTLRYTVSDVVASLGSGISPLQILMQQGGQVLEVFPAVAGKILAVGAAVAAIGAPIGIVGGRIASIARETREFDAVLRGMGGRSEVSAGQLRDFAFASAKVGGSLADANEAAMALARNPAIRDANLFRDILQLAPDVAALLGTSIPNAAEKVGQAFAFGASGVAKLDSELRFLNKEQAEQIRQLERQGNRAGALNIALDALKKQVSGTAHAMRSEWGNALHEAVTAWDAFVERIATSEFSNLVAARVGSAGRQVREFIQGPPVGVDLLKQQLAQVDAEYARLPEKSSGTHAAYEALITRRMQLVQQIESQTKKATTEAGNLRTGIRHVADEFGGVLDKIDAVTSVAEFPSHIQENLEFSSVFEEAMK